MEQTFIDTTAGFRALPGLELQQRQLKEQKRWRQDQIAQRQAEMAQRQAEIAQRAAEQFGAYAVRDSNGGIDIEASARAMQAGQQAAQLGEAEALSGHSFADVDQAIRQMPEYRVGFAKGAASEATQQRRFDALMDVQGARGQTAEDVARIRAEAMGEIQTLKDLMKTPPTAKDEFATVESEGPGGTNIRRQVRVEDLPSILGAGGAPVSSAVRQRLKLLQDAKDEVLMMSGDKVDFEFSDTGEPKVKKAGWWGNTPKAKALQQIDAEIERITGGKPGGGMPSVPKGTNRELPGVTMGAESIRDILGSVRTNAPAQGGGPTYMYDAKTKRMIRVQPLPQR